MTYRPRITKVRFLHENHYEIHLANHGDTILPCGILSGKKINIDGSVSSFLVMSAGELMPRQISKIAVNFYKVKAIKDLQFESAGADRVSLHGEIKKGWFRSYRFRNVSRSRNMWA